METSPAAPENTATTAKGPKSKMSNAPAPVYATQPPLPGIAALRCLAAALLSGGLLWACYHPLAWGFLGWIALAPLLVLVRTQTRPLLVYLFAYLCGLVFFVPALSWMSVAHTSMVAAWLALSVYCSLYFPIALAMIRALDRRRVPLLVSVPLVWVALEFFRCHFLTGFPWYLLAHTQHDWLPMIQIADLGGVFLISAVVVAVNALAFDFVYQFAAVRKWFNQAELEPYRYYASLEFLNRGFMASWLFRRNLFIETPILVILLISTYMYGLLCLSQVQFTAGPTVALLQSNIDQRLREGIGAQQNGEQAAETMKGHFSKLCESAIKNGAPDLIIWPETSFPTPWIDVSSELPIEKVPTEWRDSALDIQFRLKELAKTSKIPHLLGMNSYCLEADAKPHHYNSALFLGKSGKIEARFDKIHRVPFGEYIPLKDWLPFLAKLSPYEGDFGCQAGEKMTRFKINQHRFGVLICYEDTDPFLARRYVQETDDGPPVDFLVNISNDGWFDGSAEHEEHLAVCRFRAIECRRSMVRAVNMGVSAVIDGNGRVLKPTLYPGLNPTVFVLQGENNRVPELQTSDWHHFKKTAFVFKANVPIDRRGSLYAMTGDVLPIGCWAVLIGAAGWTYYSRKRRPVAA